MMPARFLRNPEDCWRRGTLRGLPGRRLRFLGIQFRVPGFEGVGNVIKEDQAERDVLVLGRVRVVAQRRRPPRAWLRNRGGAADPLFFALLDDFFILDVVFTDSCRHG